MLSCNAGLGGEGSVFKPAYIIVLRELMMELFFEKINVAQICERCNMNRKSFYYHFKDKYDRVNWIFDTEFIALLPFNASRC